jgi:glycine hydroxymethyltransferase
MVEAVNKLPVEDFPLKEKDPEIYGMIQNEKHR